MFTVPVPILFRFTFGLLIAAGLSLSGPGPTSAQSAAGTEAWFGVPQPTGLDVPPQFSVLERGDFTAPAAPVPPGEEGMRSWRVCGSSGGSRTSLDSPRRVARRER